MKKKVKTQNGKPKISADYKGCVYRVYYLDEHIRELIERRNIMVEHIKAAFDKSDENIIFELSKLGGE